MLSSVGTLGSVAGAAVFPPPRTALRRVPDDKHTFQRGHCAHRGHQPCSFLGRINMGFHYVKLGV